MKNFKNFISEVKSLSEKERSQETENAPYVPDEPIHFKMDDEKDEKLKRALLGVDKDVKMRIDHTAKMKEAQHKNEETRKSQGLPATNPKFDQSKFPGFISKRTDSDPRS